MKKPSSCLTVFALAALLPFVSGCYSALAIQKANRHTVETRFYNSADEIEKAGITKDNQLCIFFEKDLTNSGQNRFALTIPLAQIRTNVQNQSSFTFGIMRSTNYYDVEKPHFSQVASNFLFQNVPFAEKTNPLFAMRSVTYATIHMPAGSVIRTNLENSENDLKFIPVGTPLIVGIADDAAHHCSDLMLLSNATQTVYLTKTNPIEFTYIDTSIKRSFTTVAVDPIIVLGKHTDHPRYYFLLPLTIPADIATSPFQFLIYLGFRYGDWHM